MKPSGHSRAFPSHLCLTRVGTVPQTNLALPHKTTATRADVKKATASVPFHDATALPGNTDKYQLPLRGSQETGEQEATLVLK